jgi:hypothetical protein
VLFYERYLVMLSGRERIKAVLGDHRASGMQRGCSPDSSVFVSALLSPEGGAAQILELWAGGDLDLVVSRYV